MSCNNVQILNFNHNIVEVGPDNKIVITDQVKCNSITIPQPVTNILQVNSPGPQGLQGPVAFPYTGSAAITGSLVITGSLTISGSNTFTNIGPAIFIGNQTITGSIIFNSGSQITSTYYGNNYPGYIDIVAGAPGGFVELLSYNQSSSVNVDDYSVYITTQSGSLFNLWEFKNSGRLLAPRGIEAPSFTGSFTGSLIGTTTTASSADAFTVRGNLIVSGNMTFGDATTDTITLNANTINLGSGTGTLNIDSNTLYVDGANNRVGIGTTSPAMSFDVNGGGSFTSPLRIGGGGYISNAYNLQINSNSSTDTPIRIQGGYGTIQIEKDSSSTSAVAIGLSKPGVSIGDDYVLSLYKSTGGGWIERMRFTQAGNLLITGSTTSTLGFTGSLQGTSSYAITASYALVSSGTVTNAVSASYALTASYAMNGGGGGGGSSFPYNGNAVITGSLLVSGSTGGLILTGSFSQNASTASFGGLVGIGTETPGYKLDVSGSTNLNLSTRSNFLRLQSGAGEKHTYIQTAFSNLLIANNATYDGSDYRYDQTGFSTQMQMASNAIAFYTAGAGTAGNIPTYLTALRIDQGAVVSFPSLTNVTQSNIVSVNTATGQLYYQNIIPTSSYAYTASFVKNAISSSYALTASYAATYSFVTVQVQVQPYISSSNVDGPYGFNSILTASYAVNSTTASYASYAVNSTTASYAENAATAFPYTGDAEITGSLLVSEHLEVYSGSIVPYYTVTGIDLSAATYDITGSGIFEITTVDFFNPLSITFPDPSTHDGQTIFVVNTDNYNALIDNTNTYAPYNRGTNTQLPAIGGEEMYHFISIGGKWRGMAAGK